MPGLGEHPRIRYDALVLILSSDYHWQELWRALILLLDFLASKLDSLTTTGGVEQLTHEVCYPMGTMHSTKG